MKRSTRGLLTGLIVAGMSVFAFGVLSPGIVAAQEGHDDSDPTSEFPKPGPEHQMLHRAVGSWTATSTMYEGDQSMKSEASEEVKSLCGGLWIQADFKGSMAGVPFTGHACEGYDPSTKKFVGTWFDSFTTRPTPYEGECDETGKVFTYKMTAMGMDGNPTIMTMQTTWIDDDNRTMKMFAGPDTSAPLSMEVVYTRK